MRDPGITYSEKSQSGSGCNCTSLCVGKQVIRGNAGKAFQPFLLPEEMKKNLGELKNKLMVGFDPQKYLISEIEASNKIAYIFFLTDVTSL